MSRPDGPAGPCPLTILPCALLLCDLQAVVAAAPQLVTDLNRTCELLGEPHDCLDTLTSLLRPHADFEPATAAAKICYAKLPEAFLPPRCGAWPVCCCSRRCHGSQ